jgi:hypothetical protein
MAPVSADGLSIRSLSGRYDFVRDRTQDGRPLKLLPIVEEYTRDCRAAVYRARESVGERRGRILQRKIAG